MLNRSKLPLLYKIVKEALELKLSKDMEDCPAVSFTTDLWSSRNQDPYLGLTMHYIDRSWKMNRLMVHCGPAEGRHPEIRKALDSFKLLTSKTHKSSLCYQRIRRECEKMSKDDSFPHTGNTY